MSSDADTSNKDIAINLPELRTSLIYGAKEGYDQVVAQGQMSHSSAILMIGYLSAGLRVFDMIGDTYHADLFRTTANRLRTDWKAFVDIMQSLFQLCDIQGDLD